MSAIDHYLTNNADYVAHFCSKGLPAAPAQRVAIVTCMDARLEMGALVGLKEGGAHVIRNAGAVVTEDVIRSLTLSQCLLGTREIMVINHTDCGLTTLTDEQLRDTIELETGVRPTFEMGAFKDLEDDVRQSVARLRASPFVVHKQAIRGFVYDVDTGRLDEVT